MLTPSFHFKILEQFNEVFNRNADVMISRLSSHVDGPQFDITSYIVMCTLDVVCGESLSCRIFVIWHTLYYMTSALGCII
jgi:cytochrome P450 family 4